MTKGINKVFLIGNLGADPEVRYTANGAAVANIRLATTESWRDRQTGDQVEKTEWHRVMFFNRLAEVVCEYLRKGSQVYIEGKLQTRKWQDGSGQDRYTTEIVANVLQMVGGQRSPNNLSVTHPVTPKPEGSSISSKHSDSGGAKGAIRDEHETPPFPFD